MTTKQQFEAEEIIKRALCKLEFLFQALLDLNGEGFEQNAVLGLAFIIYELKQDVAYIMDFLNQLNAVEK